MRKVRRACVSGSWSPHRCRGRSSGSCSSPAIAVRGKTLVARLRPAASPLIDPRTQARLRAAVDAARAAVGQAQAERERAIAARARRSPPCDAWNRCSRAVPSPATSSRPRRPGSRRARKRCEPAEFALARATHELDLARARLTPSSAAGNGERPRQSMESCSSGSARAPR